MNREKIIADANRIFSDLNQVSDNLYKGELRIEQKSAGVFFIDLHGNLKADTFKDFQEEVLADEYYNQDKQLQWNIYFLLIMDMVESKDKDFIENDQKYARKYVFTETEFVEFFKVNGNKANIQSDIVTIWKNKLDKVDLQEVYGNETYIDGVNRFLSNTTLKPKPNNASVGTTDATRINFINQVMLAPEPAFRPYPIIRQFEFGKVNLIKGVNGVGKTSTLEAIELIACGKTYRNHGNKENDGCVKAVINGNFTAMETCTPTNNAKYKSRDLLWYQNGNTRSNELYRSFNRFNFFDSDAANNFSQSNSEDKVTGVLENLILGGEFKHLKDRVEGFSGRFRTELNRLSALIDENRGKIQAAEKILFQQNNDTGLDLLSKDLTDKLTGLQLLKLPVLQVDNLAPVEIIINQIKTIAERIKGSDAKIIKNQKSLNDAFGSVNERIKAFNDFRSQLTEITKSISDKELLIKEITQKIEVLESATQLLANPRLLSLEGVKEKIAIAAANVRKIKLIEDRLLSIGYQSLSETVTFDEFFKQSNNIVAGMKQEIAEISSTITSRLQLLQSIERLVQDVKDKGKEILLADPTIKDCPLCNTHLGQEELSNRINNMIVANQSAEPGNDRGSLVESRVQKENNLSLLESKLTSAQILKDIYEQLFDKSAGNLQLSSCINEIAAFYLGKGEFEKVLSDLESLVNYGVSHSMTENKLQDIKTNLYAVTAGKYKLDEKQKGKIEEELQVSRISKSKEEHVLELLNGSKENSAQKIKLKLELPPDQIVKTSEMTKALEAELTELTSLLNSYDQLGAVMTIDNEEIVDDLYSRGDAVERSLESLKKAIASNHQLAQAKKDKADGEKLVKEKEKSLKRLKAAVELLEELDAKGGSTELASFFESNFNQVLDIFKTIHAPREFVNLIYNDGQIMLIDKTGKARSVSQISTGQRAALALSIFISMNKMLTQGPNIIIFDDPISHVDDLNALSFLDYLRIFMLRERKQIFFASANARLVSLFEKKFGFLGSNDFKQWELKRENSESYN